MIWEYAKRKRGPTALIIIGWPGATLGATGHGHLARAPAMRMMRADSGPIVAAISMARAFTKYISPTMPAQILDTTNNSSILI